MAAYTDISGVQTSFPELAFFRTFNRVNNESLLRQQADLNWQEFQLQQELDKHSAVQNIPWNKIQQADSDSKVGKLRLKYERFQEALRVFSASFGIEWQSLLIITGSDLLQTVQINALAAPSSQSQQTMQQWLYDTAKPNGLNPYGIEFWPWQEQFRKDSIAMFPRPEHLDRVFSRSLTSLIHKLCKRWKKLTPDEEKYALREYNEKLFIRIADVIAALASAVVPAASIIALYFVHEMRMRFVVILGFLLILAGVLSLCFDVGRSNTFAATVAFAAVQVVFVQGVGQQV